MNDLIGDSSKKRMLALAVDHALAFVLSLIVAGMVNSLGNFAVVTALSVTYLMYFFVFEALWSRTPGKYLFGLWVCRRDGSRCTWQSAVVRTFLRIIEVNPLLFGGLPAGIMLMVTKRKQRLGDLLAGTVVVRKIN